MRAAAVVEGRCEGIGARSGVEVAEALTEVGAVWTEVAHSFEEHRAPYLLYWRGVLAQCLAQDARALSDLLDFIRLAEADAGQSSLVQDARRRTRLIRRGVPLAWQASLERDGGRTQRDVGLALIVGGSGAAAFGGLMHGISFADAELSRTEVGWTSTSDADAPGWKRLQDLNRAGFAVLAAGATTAAVGVAITLSGLARDAEPPAVAVWLRPANEGALLGVTARF